MVETTEVLYGLGFVLSGVVGAVLRGKPKHRVVDDDAEATTPVQPRGTCQLHHTIVRDLDRGEKTFAALRNGMEQLTSEVSEVKVNVAALGTRVEYIAQTLDRVVKHQEERHG